MLTAKAEELEAETPKELDIEFIKEIIRSDANAPIPAKYEYLRQEI